MMKLTASPFSKRKTRNLIISSLNQNKTQNLNGFLEKKNTQEQKPQVFFKMHTKQI